MCGIAGIVGKKDRVDDFKNILMSANSQMFHRGPDSEGYYFKNNVGFSMRRLSIIDLEGGSQPLFNHDGSIALVCNGEIYNHVELRNELRSKGVVFKTNSDCEVIIYLYQLQGVEGFKRLRGMFAFALHDVTQNKLVICRDRFGERPFFYYQDEHSLLFASEIKALLPNIPKERLSLSAEAAFEFLSFQYVHEPKTMFNEVKKLPSAHFAIIDLNDPKIEPVSYWSYLDAPLVNGNPNTIVRDQIEEAVEIMLRADVPVGLSLSGGIDSSLIAAIVRKKTNATIKAFSIGYPGRPENDEREMAAKLAKSLDIEFFEAELSANQFISTLPRLIKDMDEPIGDIAAFGYWSVNKLAHEQNIKVLLSGLGADELFWGYQWVRTAAINARSKSRNLKGILEKLFFQKSRVPKVSFFKELGWVGSSAAQVLGIMNEQAVSRARLDDKSWLACESQLDQRDIVLSYLDLHNRTWLTSNCLALSDRMGLSHSVETRLPFLDHVLVDSVTGLRKGGLKDEAFGHKKVLIDSVKDLLPREILERPKKGFTPPTDVWMEQGKARYGFLLRESVLVRERILNDRAVEFLKNDQGTGLGFRILLLELWGRLFIDRLSPQDIIDLAAKNDFKAN